MDYKLKYIKYKLKYIKLKGGMGGFEHFVNLPPVTHDDMITGNHYIYIDLPNITEYVLYSQLNSDNTYKFEMISSSQHIQLNNLNNIRKIPTYGLSHLNYDTILDFLKMINNNLIISSIVPNEIFLNESIKQHLKIINPGTRRYLTYNDISNQIISGNFSSLYKYNGDAICLRKNREEIQTYINTFNSICYYIPKPNNNYFLFRAEYISDANKIYRMIHMPNYEIPYYVPFSTTHNFQFALNWIFTNVIYIIQVPVHTNALYLKYQDQSEVVLQQGKLIISYTLYHKIINDDNELIKYIFICDFIPVNVKDNVLPPRCP